MRTQWRAIALRVAAGSLAALSLAGVTADAQGTHPFVEVVSATYGGNCPASYRPDPQYPQGGKNMTAKVKAKCRRGSSACSFPVDHRVIGDPALGCAKDFVIEYHCLSPNNFLGVGGANEATIGPEASGHTVTFFCSPNPGHTVRAGY